MKKCIMHDGGKQMREKAVSREPGNIRRMWRFCGLFAALVAVGGIYQGCHSDRRRYHELHLAVVFRDAGSISAGLQTGIYQWGVYLLIGLAGVPIFARGGGPAYLLRPTFGFLLGFLLRRGSWERLQNV